MQAARECEQVFAGREDGLDPLPDRGEVRASLRFVAACGAVYARAEQADLVGEGAAGVAFVADDRLAASQRAWQQRQRDLALGAVGGDDGRRAWGAVGGAGQVQAHARNQREWLRE